MINLQGRVFMPNHVEDPFRSVDEILKERGGNSPVVIVDMHAEATSEKYAMGWYLDGRASLVLWHAYPRADCGRADFPGGHRLYHRCWNVWSVDSVIGMEKETVIRGFITQLPRQFEVAQDNVVLQGVIVDIDDETAKLAEIRRLRVHWEAKH